MRTLWRGDQFRSGSQVGIVEYSAAPDESQQEVGEGLGEDASVSRVLNLSGSTNAKITILEPRVGSIH